MKSSCKVLRSGAAPVLPAWRPVDLVETTSAEAEAWRARLAEIFLPVSEPTSDAAPARRTQPECAAWQPAELSSWVPPFRTGGDDWFFETPPEMEEPSENAAVEAQAAAILSEARRQAEEIILQAQLEADQLLQQAQDEHERMTEEAYQKGWEQAKAEAAPVLEAAASLTHEIHTWRDALLAQGETLLLDMLKDVALVMFGDGVVLDDQALQMNLNRVVENARSLGDLKIFLNPRDAAVLDPAWREYQSVVSGSKVQVIPSERITRGGCFIQGQMGTVDARVETQMHTVLEALAQEKARQEGLE